MVNLIHVFGYNPLCIYKIYKTIFIVKKTLDMLLVTTDVRQKLSRWSYIDKCIANTADLPSVKDVVIDIHISLY